MQDQSRCWSSDLHAQPCCIAQSVSVIVGICLDVKCRPAKCTKDFFRSSIIVGDENLAVANRAPIPVSTGIEGYHS